MKMNIRAGKIHGLTGLFFAGFFLSFCYPLSDVFPAETSDSMARQYYEEGVKYLSLGEYEKADEAFKKAEESVDLLSGENSAAGSPRQENPASRGKNEPGKDDNAREEQAGKDMTGEESLVSEARDAYNRGDMDKAMECYTDLSRLYPGNAEVYYNLGIILLKKREYSAAARYFEKTVSLSPEDSDAYYNLGVIYAGFLGDKKTALRFYNKYLLFSQDEVEKDRVISWMKELR